MEKKLYFIDDNINKYNNFLYAIEVSNEDLYKKGESMRFIPGFGNDPGVKAGFWSDIRNVDKYFEALECEGALFFIDLRIEESFVFSTEILKRVNSNEKYKEISKEYAKLRDSVSFSGEPNKILALMTLAICSKLGIRSFIASVQAEHIGYVGELKELGYESFEGFIPPNPAVSKNDALIKKIAEKLIYLMDPLDEISTKSYNWFINRALDVQYSILPHNYWEVIAIPDGREKHMDIVRAKFPWLSSIWWNTDEKLSLIHNCLKSFCGPHMQWTLSGKTPLSLVGVYFIFLYVLETNIKKFQLPIETIDRFLLPDLTCFFYNNDLIPFFTNQPNFDARLSLIALIDFFTQISIKKVDKVDNVRELSFTSISGPTVPTNFAITIQLNWSKSERDEFSNQLSSTINRIFKGGNHLPKGTAVSAFLRFAILNQNNVDGFGNNTGIKINKLGELIIGYGI